MARRNTSASFAWYERLLSRHIRASKFLSYFDKKTKVSSTETEANTGDVLLRKGVLRNLAKFKGKHFARISFSSSHTKKMSLMADKNYF